MYKGQRMMLDPVPQELSMYFSTAFGQCIHVCADVNMEDKGDISIFPHLPH